ncbi:MAG: hypothetical protein H6739_34570 [Alphaproteobacteria bacterium]|nr:hypothetical protein [Alphaproteobacteria bacterium]
MANAKSALLIRDRYQILVAAWRAADLLAAHQLREDGAERLFIEREQFDGLDDIVEWWSDSPGRQHYRAWQVKDQETDLDWEHLQKPLQALIAHPELDRAVLFISHNVSVVDGRRKLGELRVLGRLADRLRAGEVEVRGFRGQLNGIQTAWVEALESRLGVGTATLVGLLGRLFIVREDDATAIVRRGRERLSAAWFEQPEAAWTALVDFIAVHPFGESAVTADGLLQGPLRQHARRPPRPPRRALEERGRFLRGLQEAWERRSLLNDSMALDGLGLTLKAVWVARRIAVAVPSAFAGGAVAVDVEARDGATGIKGDVVFSNE